MSFLCWEWIPLHSLFIFAAVFWKVSQLFEYFLETAWVKMPLRTWNLVLRKLPISIIACMWNLTFHIAGDVVLTFWTYWTSQDASKWVRYGTSYMGWIWNGIGPIWVIVNGPQTMYSPAFAGLFIMFGLHWDQLDGPVKILLNGSGMEHPIWAGFGMELAQFGS